MKKLLIFGLLIISQNILAMGESKKPTDSELQFMQVKRMVYSEVAMGAAATFACGASIAVTLKNKGGANAGSYIGCAALYTALRQAVNVYQMDKEIEEKEQALALEEAKKQALESVKK